MSFPPSAPAPCEPIAFFFTIRECFFFYKQSCNDALFRRMCTAQPNERPLVQWDLLFFTCDAILYERERPYEKTRTCQHHQFYFCHANRVKQDTCEYTDDPINGYKCLRP